jgi:hypothetical protein
MEFNPNVCNICKKCGATFLNGIFYWGGTGKQGNPVDLASLVCQPYGNADCINPERYTQGGDTWDKRLQFIQNNPFGGQSNG